LIAAVGRWGAAVIVATVVLAAGCGYAPGDEVPAYQGDPIEEHGYNDEGCPQTEWVEGYTKANGTVVDGYWRNPRDDGCGD
jgi:hypothetical protein